MLSLKHSVNSNQRSDGDQLIASHLLFKKSIQTETARTSAERQMLGEFKISVFSKEGIILMVRLW